MRVILISKRGEFYSKHNDYAMALAVKRLAQLIKPSTQEEPEEKVEIVYSRALQQTSR